MKIGAQLFTLRDFCKTTEDFSQTLARVAEIGYTTVQVSGVCPYEPAWLKAELDKNGLTCAITHTSFDRMLESPETVLAEHKIFGCDYIGIGYYNGLREEEDLDRLVDAAHKLGKVFAPAGAKFMYHNHYEEMNRGADGKTRLISLMERTTPEEIGITVDTYWLQYGGADVADYFKALAGRIDCVHFKDMRVVGKEIRMAPVGEGSINFEKLIPLCYDGGTKYILIEQDNCYGEDPFDCLARSYRYLKAQGLS